MPIKEINKEVVRQLMTEIRETLHILGDKHGLHITVGGATYSGNNFRFKAEAALVTESGEVMSREVIDFQRMARLYDLSPAILNKTFTHKTHAYKIVGLASRAARFPIICERASDKKQFSFPSETVKEYEHLMLESVPEVALSGKN